MRLSQSLEHRIAAYVDHQSGIDPVRDWLIDHAQAVSDAHLEEPWAEELADQVWWAVDAYDRQEWDDRTLRDVLRQLVPTRHLTAGDGVTVDEGVFASGTGSRILLSHETLVAV